MTDSPGASRTIEDIVNELRRRIDQQFTTEQLEEIRTRVQESELRLARLRSFPLDNGDEPAPGFRPFRQEDGSR